MSIPYDPTKHHRNALGRWADRATGQLVKLDPATIPAGEATAPTGPAKPTPAAEVDGPARELAAAPLPPVPPVALEAMGGAPSASESAQPSGSYSPGPSGPSSEPSSQASPWTIPTIDPAASDPAAGLVANPSVPHDPECWKGAVEGRPCPRCLTAIYQALPPDELAASVALHEVAVNRFSPHPRPYTEAERNAVGGAMQLIARRYGNPLAEWAPIMAIGAVTMGAIGARRAEPDADKAGGS